MRILNFENPLSEWNRNFALVAVSAFGVSVFLGVHFSLFNNYIVARLAIEPHHLGYVEALREVPGFLNALFIALMIRLAPSLVAGVALMVMGLGVMAYAQLASVVSLALYSVVWSIGFHCWMPLEQTLALNFSPRGNKGKWLGQLASVGGIATLLGIGLCLVLMPYLHYEGMYIVAGGAVIIQEFDNGNTVVDGGVGECRVDLAVCDDRHGILAGKGEDTLEKKRVLPGSIVVT